MKYPLHIYGTALLVLGMLSGCNSSDDSSDDKSLPVEPKGRWVQGDMHVHSTASDGHNLVSSILDIGYSKFGLDFIASTEHSGFKRYEINEGLWRMRVTGLPILNPNPTEELHSHDYAKDQYPDDKVYTSRAADNNKLYQHLVAYREQKLIDDNADKYLLTGMEYTMPYIKEHTTLVLLDDGDVDEINEFHYLYGEGDRFEDDPRKQDMDDLLEAVTFLEDNYADRAFLSFNHPSRKHEVTIEYIRELHNAAPNIIIGMEGAPGHQRNPAARGSYEMEEPIYLDEFSDYQGPAYNGRTYGGFDYMTARIGGVWDALLSEGRRISVFAHSDFHSMIKDFWPGEYSKSNIYLEEENQQGLLQAIKDGKSFVTHGDLISDLYFTAHEAENSNNHAWMGDELKVPAGKNVDVTISMNLPLQNNNGDKPDLAFVDVIAGRVTGPVEPGDPNFTKPFADNVEILTSFEKDDPSWSLEGQTLTLEFVIPEVTEDMYIRLRGSNNPKGTPNFVDEQGNPIIDTQKDNYDPAALAWSDLWFYSNPIFISAN
ncbi:hypothetical protein C9I98_02520 [Photobacterium sanctipauli]|uniref:Histidinol-phosphatase n=1 Tax=Photobacterium sanctipauli TaxID=1342794 RepID=A0A2T3P103_9GAMM|nr:hypothetical protein [Photobacterium sanctipauli]PSW22159.1 hypothetical protein C9I98_02520 [Photobacterium sanctipauli]